MRELIALYGPASPYVEMYEGGWESCDTPSKESNRRSATYIIDSLEKAGYAVVPSAGRDALKSLLATLPSSTQLTNIISGLDLLDEITAAAVITNPDGTINQERTDQFAKVGANRSAQEGLALLRDAVAAYEKTLTHSEHI
jgi:hypothetical protein